MKKTVIAISRAFGSGGAPIGRKLAQTLGVPLFDRKLIELASEKSGLSADYIENLENHATSSFLFNLAAAAYPSGSFAAPYEMPVTFSAYAAQSSVIREAAARDSCVIVGRCAEYVLQDDPNCVKVFLYANREDRVKFTMHEFNLDAKAAEAKLAKLDKARATYYKDFTGETWGNVYAHDLAVNTSVTGHDGAVEVIMGFLRACGRL